MRAHLVGCEKHVARVSYAPNAHTKHLMARCFCVMLGSFYLSYKSEHAAQNVRFFFVSFFCANCYIEPFILLAARCIQKTFEMTKSSCMPACANIFHSRFSSAALIWALPLLCQFEIAINWHFLCARSIDCAVIINLDRSLRRQLFLNAYIIILVKCLLIIYARIV